MILLFPRVSIISLSLISLIGLMLIKIVNRIKDGEIFLFETTLKPRSIVFFNNGSTFSFKP